MILLLNCCDIISMIHYGEKIKTMRRDRNITQALLAELTNIPQTSISTWEKNPDPPLNFIRKSLEVMDDDVSLWQFFYEEEEKENTGVAFLPPYIKPEQAETLRIINTKFDIETRIAIWKAFLSSLEAVAIAAGVEID